MAVSTKSYVVSVILLGMLASRLSASDADESKCNSKVIKTCLIPLEEVQYDVATAVLPHMNEETLRDHCRRYSMFETCMRDVRPHCSKLDQLIYEGIEEAYKWMCKDGFQEYLTYQKCFSKKELHNEGRTCNDTLTKSIKNIKQNSYSNAEKYKYICLYVEQYLDCVQNVVEIFCSLSAAMWQRTLDEKSMLPLLQAIGCHVSGSMDFLPSHHTKIHWIPVTIGIVLTVAIIIILISVVMLFMQRHRRRQPNLSDRTPAFPVSPPPYDGPGPFIVFDGQAVNMVENGSAQAGPLPAKVEPGYVGLQVPPYPGDATTDAPKQSTSAYEEIAAGYFGALAAGAPEPSTPSIPEVPNISMEGKTTPSNEQTSQGLAEANVEQELSSSATGITNPMFKEVEELGYFGAAPSQSKKK